MNLKRSTGALILGFALLCHISEVQEITVAPAADLQFAMQEIAARFQKETGKSVKVICGSSSNFFQQIENGAPFDMFFSANLDYPKKLEAAGLIQAGSYYQIRERQNRGLGSQGLKDRRERRSQSSARPDGQEDCHR